MVSANAAALIIHSQGHLMTNTVSTSSGDHSHTDQAHDRLVTIYVNTDPHRVKRGPLTFAQIVALAYPDKAADATILFKVSYRLGRGHSDLKTLAEGGTVEAQEGMIFNVSYENRS
jgi:hypothetical protein